MASNLKEEEYYNTADLRLTASYHMDHIVELQIIAKALNRLYSESETGFKYKEETLKKIVDFFNNIENLQVLPAQENITKRNAIAKLIKRSKSETYIELSRTDKYYIEMVSNHWIRELKPKLENQNVEKLISKIDEIMSFK